MAPWQLDPAHFVLAQTVPIAAVRPVLADAGVA